MGKKKKRGGRARSALSPVDKKGIKLATLLTEAGLITEALNRGDLWKSNPGEAAVRTFTNIFDINTPGGKMFLTGILMKLGGKYVPELRNLGVVGFR